VSNVANLSDVAANAEATALGALMNLGTIALYSGTQPATANTALSGNTLLATLTFGSPAFGPAGSGAIAANPIGSGVAVATGTATFARIRQSDAVTVVMDVAVGTSGAGIDLNTTAIVQGATVSISGFVHTVTET
jgi:hypothetical protein